MMSIIETIAAKKEKLQQQTIDLQNIKRQSNVTTTTQNTDRLIYLQQIRFLLCQSCFWCASYVITSDCSSNNNSVLTFSTLIKKCPICKNDKIKSLPISHNEHYKLDSNFK
jgi:hypothetical protein